MLANATVFLPSEAALEALGQEGREALLEDKYSRSYDDDDNVHDVHDDDDDYDDGDVNDDDDFDDGLRANSRPRGKRGFAARQVFTIMTMMVMMMFIIIIMMMLMLMKMIMFRIMNENIKAYQFDLIY